VYYVGLSDVTYTSGLSALEIIPSQIENRKQSGGVTNQWGRGHSGSRPKEGKKRNVGRRAGRQVGI
jgi:hypothetical protein